jgi:hypothetical protein
MVKLVIIVMSLIFLTCLYCMKFDALYTVNEYCKVPTLNILLQKYVYKNLFKCKEGHFRKRHSNLLQQPLYVVLYL